MSQYTLKEFKAKYGKEITTEHIAKKYGIKGKLLKDFKSATFNLDQPEKR